VNNLSFTKWELTRYSRNILLPEVGRQGQEKLSDSKVGIVGVGGLGSPVSLYLTASGIGDIKIIDSDDLDLTNLQRQVIYSTDQVGSSKVDSATLNLKALNPNVRISGIQERITAQSVDSLFGDRDLILEGSDNFQTKFLINDYCVLKKIPLVLGGILGFEGQILGIRPRETPCYRCIFSDIPPEETIPNCSEAGVLGSVAGVVGTMMATMALNSILGVGDALGGFLLSLDLKTFQFRKINLSRNKKCMVCGEYPTITSLEPERYLSKNFC
jgi:molybdopterin-synthase adenylyltransferase